MERFGRLTRPSNLFRMQGQAQKRVRFFALGIGDAVSHRLVEGIGRQGGGFAEVVAVDAAGKWESRVIRMLTTALMPSQWKWEITLPQGAEISPAPGNETRTPPVGVLADSQISRPHILQAPYHIPSLHSFSHSSVFFFLDQLVLDQKSSIKIQAQAS